MLILKIILAALILFTLWAFLFAFSLAAHAKANENQSKQVIEDAKRSNSL